MTYKVEFLERAIDLGESGLGLTFPNPIVGAVIVNTHGEVIGEGFHSGGAHAEVIAIADAYARGNDLVGATLYCSLEPCNHHGKTPPCSEAIIESGIKEVFFAISDPNPKAAGGGQRLIDSGLLVNGDLLVEEAQFSNRAWLTKISLHRPYITVKIAQSLDGRIAAADGRSKWITTQSARAHAKSLRSDFDAICIGTQTAELDNPTLRGERGNPQRIVIGERTLGALLLDEEEGYLQIKSRDFSQVLTEFEGLGYNSVLIEGGATLISAALAAGIVDEIHLYQSGAILGAGTSSVAISEFTNFSQQLHFEITTLSIIEGDIFAIYMKKDVG
jgi:diaminohydroxyphosphoribosylaminopyrimidine deaminase/5-amino-6-(5-phosphoribosylamino)uracil reductase